MYYQNIPALFCLLVLLWIFLALSSLKYSLSSSLKALPGSVPFPSRSKAAYNYTVNNNIIGLYKQLTSIALYISLIDYSLSKHGIRFSSHLLHWNRLHYGNEEQEQNTKIMEILHDVVAGVESSISTIIGSSYSFNWAFFWPTRSFIGWCCFSITHHYWNHGAKFSAI